MSNLADLYHYWGDDLQQAPTGDLLPALQLDRSSQRIIRRILTNPGGGDYPWQPEYGAGLPAKIGDNLDIGHLTALIIGQIALEPTVARNPAPRVTLTPFQGGVSISVIYFDTSGQGKNLFFRLTAAPAQQAFPVPALEAQTPPSAHQLPGVELGPTTTIQPSSAIEPAAEGF